MKNVLWVIVLVALGIFMVWQFIEALDKTAQNRLNYYCHMADQTNNLDYLKDYCGR